ncbi:hypothetical protein GDO81_022704, partial [Engystomops pustulosus]
MGGDPVVEMKKIRELLDIRKNNNREDFLDVYVFGLGEDISENEINDIASKKDPEKHVFKMESVDHMKEAFDEMLGNINKTLKVKNIHRHRKYNPAGKQDKKVEKSFDYDLALIELENKIEYSRKVRPVCLPCTTGTSWALKQRGKAVTCSDHENTVLDSELVKAMFVAEETRYKFERMNVTIKRGDKVRRMDNDKKH